MCIEKSIGADRYQWLTLMLFSISLSKQQLLISSFCCIRASFINSFRSLRMYLFSYFLFTGRITFQLSFLIHFPHSEIHTVPGMQDPCGIPVDKTAKRFAFLQLGIQFRKMGKKLVHRDPVRPDGEYDIDRCFQKIALLYITDSIMDPLCRKYA